MKNGCDRIFLLEESCGILFRKIEGQEWRWLPSEWPITGGNVGHGQRTPILECFLCQQRRWLPAVQWEKGRNITRINRRDSRRPRWGPHYRDGSTMLRCLCSLLLLSLHFENSSRCPLGRTFWALLFWDTEVCA